ncbi:hypothetical protein RFI_04700 [Reticulomyxa filosa]|uniref:Uncharacterized protein n=1 Tax=Reticulomyxa filosa TaxID=46433 RepID=X6P4A4_RETFI|nr:hypothetical protein RFI_04700 [Reticulomyxa filosa]|eukprot:ETO32417.1 hypothetical protein RFI_04700 [Reticulomyxa filosa]
MTIKQREKQIQNVTIAYIKNKKYMNEIPLTCAIIVRTNNIKKKAQTQSKNNKNGKSLKKIIIKFLKQTLLKIFPFQSKKQCYFLALSTKFLCPLFLKKTIIMSLLTDEVKKTLERVDNSLQNIEKIYQPFFANNSLEKLNEDLSPESKAKEKGNMHTRIYVYGHLLGYCHLQNENEQVQTTSQQSLERAKQYIMKIKHVLSAEKAAAATAENEEGKEKKSEAVEDKDVQMYEEVRNAGRQGRRLDKGAAKRFIAKGLDKKERDAMWEKFGTEMSYL